MGGGSSGLPVLVGVGLAFCFGLYGFVKANFSKKKFQVWEKSEPVVSSDDEGTKNVSSETDFFLHNSMDSRYWYFDGLAYNMESFIKKHPGGQLAITHGKGREVKLLVYSYHLDIKKVLKQLEQYKVYPEIRCETFKPSQKFTFEEDGFFMTCKRKGLEFFREKSATGMPWKAPPLWVAWNTFFMILSPALLYVACIYPQLGLTFWQAGLVMFAHGYTRAVIIMQSTHAATHFAMFECSWLNRLYYQITIVISSVWLSQSWDVQHVIGHHVFTNQWPYDSDSGFPVRSLTHEQRRMWYHKYQHIYSWFVYATLCPNVFINTVREQLYGKQNAFVFRYHTWIQLLELPYEMIAMPLYFGALYFYHDFLTATILTMIGALITSLDFTLQFVVNHELDGIMSDEQAQRPYIKDPKQPVDFGQFQVEESNSVNPHSTFYTELAGGLNTQIEHHIFPNVHYSWYTTLAVMVEELAEQYGVEYTKSSWSEAIASHYRLLKNPPKSIRVKRADQRKVG